MIDGGPRFREMERKGEGRREREREIFCSLYHHAVLAFL